MMNIKIQKVLVISPIRRVVFQLTVTGTGINKYKTSLRISLLVRGVIEMDSATEKVINIRIRYDIHLFLFTTLLLPRDARNWTLFKRAATRIQLTRTGRFAQVLQLSQIKYS